MAILPDKLRLRETEHPGGRMVDEGEVPRAIDPVDPLVCGFQQQAVTLFALAQSSLCRLTLVDVLKEHREAIHRRIDPNIHPGVERGIIVFKRSALPFGPDSVV